MSWIDVSVPLRSGMVNWKGDPAVEVRQVASMEDGALCNVTHLNFSAHTGTHMDAPRHFLRNGAGMETMPLDAVIGPARVIEIHDPLAVRSPELPELRQGDRILLKTTNSSLRVDQPGFREDFVYIARDAARKIADEGVQTVGIDYLSVGGFHQDLVETHEILLNAGIWIIEGLNLSHVAPGNYEMACLPLLIPGSDGAPARCILRPLNE